MPAVDTRRIVGGSVWAKAEAVSRDAKRIFGAGIKTKFLEGIVQEVIVRRSETVKRATTYIKASYMVGLVPKVKILCLQTLKAADPNPPVDIIRTEPVCP
jgi:hypothetical protein